jgi:uncharacterized membrane protein YgdD (TMEM256/DUF423 family)
MKWTRRTWMPLAAASGMISVVVAALAMLVIRDARTAELLKIGATFQFMHSMASFACATFMQVGGRRAGHGPGFFLGGIALFSFPLYALAAGAPAWVWVMVPMGGMSFMAGWAILFLAGCKVDSGLAVQAMKVVQPGSGPNQAGVGAPHNQGGLPDEQELSPVISAVQPRLRTSMAMESQAVGP